MGLLNREKLCRSPEPTEQQITDAQKTVDRWVALKKIIESPGWRGLMDYLRFQLQNYDSISNAKPGDFIERQGIAKGLKLVLHYSQYLKEKATSDAEKFLNRDLQKKE